MLSDHPIQSISSKENHFKHALGFCCGVVEVSILLEYNTASLGNWAPTFQDDIVALKCWEQPITQKCSVTSQKNRNLRPIFTLSSYLRPGLLHDIFPLCHPIKTLYIFLLPDISFHYILLELITPRIMCTNYTLLHSCSSNFFYCPVPSTHSLSLQYSISTCKVITFQFVIVV
jgi:hypothetical protein